MGRTFGENVRRLRKAAQLRSKGLAAKLGVSAPVVSAWENDRTGLPEAPTLLKIARALDVTVNDLLDGVDEEHDAIAARRDAEAKKQLRGGVSLDDDEGRRRFNEALRLLDAARDQREIARLARTVLDIGADLQASSEPWVSSDTVRLARWFDRLTRDRQQSILSALSVPPAAESEAAANSGAGDFRTDSYQGPERRVAHRRQGAAADYAGEERRSGKDRRTAG